MDIQVHRLRVWENWQPSSIKALAHDPFSEHVAVGRLTGEIEICNSNEKMFVQVQIPGKDNFGLHGLSWAQIASEKGRLFGISIRGFIFEVDFIHLNIKNARDTNGGAAWCLAADPLDALLAVGGDDGAVRLFRYSGDSLEYVRTQPSVGCRVASVAFHPLQSKLFIGCADGTIRCVDKKSGSAILRLAGDFGRGISVCLWSLCVLRDSTVISGDDRGQVQIWDGEVGALISNFQQHAAEVLAIAVDANERDVFATGVDSKVSCFRRRLLDGVSISEAGPADYSWHYTTSHRPHSHDVNALCVCPSTNLLLSGGVDSKICTYSLSDFSSCRPAWVLPIPAVGLVSSSVDHSLVGIRSGSMVDLWTMTLELSQDLNSQNKVIPRNHCEFSLRLQLKGVDHVHCHSVSPDGLFLAVSRADSGTRVWALSRTNGAIAPTLLTLPTKIATATCSSLEFSRDGRRLVALSCDGRVYILKFNSESGKTKAATKSRGNKSSLANVSESPLLEALIAVELDLRGVLSDGQSIYHRIPRRITVSTDERYLAVSDCASGVYVYDIDSMRLHWRLPQRDRAVTGIRFGPSSASGALVVSYSDNTFQLFDADNCKLADWSQHNPPSKFPALLVDRPGVCEDIVFHPQHPWILFRGKGFAVFTNTSCDLPTDPKVVSYSADASEKKRITSQADINVGRKRKHLATQDTLMSERNGLVIVERYRSMTHAAFSEHGEHTQLVVMENPWMKVLEKLPDALGRKRYGT